MNQDKYKFFKDNSQYVKYLENNITRPKIIQNCRFQSLTPQKAVNINRKLYYLNVIHNNQVLRNAPLPNKYSPEYYKTAYNKMFYPNESNIPN